MKHLISRSGDCLNPGCTYPSTLDSNAGYCKGRIMLSEALKPGDKVRLQRNLGPGREEENTGWIVRGIQYFSGGYYADLHHPMGGSTFAKIDECTKEESGSTISVARALELAERSYEQPQAPLALASTNAVYYEVGRVLAGEVKRLRDQIHQALRHIGGED